MPARRRDHTGRHELRRLGAHRACGRHDLSGTRALGRCENRPGYRLVAGIDPFNLGDAFRKRPERVGVGGEHGQQLTLAGELTALEVGEHG